MKTFERAFPQRLLSSTEVVARMRGGDFPATHGGGLKVVFQDGRKASYKTMKGLLMRRLVEPPAHASVSSNWMPTICPDCGRAKINHKPKDGCKRME